VILSWDLWAHGISLIFNPLTPFIMRIMVYTVLFCSAFFLRGETAQADENRFSASTPLQGCGFPFGANGRPQQPGQLFPTDITINITRKQRMLLHVALGCVKTVCCNSSTQQQ
jgi:hypothetical protein